MVSLNDLLFQVLQPYFFYSLTFLTIACVCVKIFLKFNPTVSRRTQSILWLIPLITPVPVLLYFQPQIVISAASSSSLLVNQLAAAPPNYSIMVVVPDVFSITGLLCISGVALAIGYLLLMTVFGRRIVLKRFHVVMMAKDEYTSLQQKVKEIAHKLGLPQPKVGLIDDLMPNAFTVGYGRNTLVVFSLGLLEMLDAEELGAVVSHELAHIKAKDHLFKIASYTLNILSFFNPLSYIVASYAQRQRELLADEKGATLISQPKLMANVLTKLEAVMPEFPKTRIADRVFASLFLVSPLAYKPGVLASHPSLSHRVQNLTAIPSKPKRHRRTIVTILLLGILMTTALIAGCSAVELRLVYTHNNDNPFANGNGVLVYNASAVYTPNMQKGILFTDRQSFDNFMSFMKDPSPAENTTVNSNEDLTLKAVNSP